MNIRSLVESKSKKDANSILLAPLESYAYPTFGSKPKREVDLNFLDALEGLGALNEDPTIYELIQKLKITRTKARSLNYERELRRLDISELNRKAVEVLKKPLIHKEGSWFVLEVDNPLVSDHLRYKVSQLKCASDGSFSPSIIKLSLEAFVRLLENELPAHDRKTVTKALVEAGLKADGTFKGLVKAALKQVGKRIANDAGEDLADKIPTLIGSLWNAQPEAIRKTFSHFLKSDRK